MALKVSSTNRILVILGLGLSLSLLGDSTLYAVLPSPSIAAQAGLTIQMVGLALGLNRLVRIATNLPAGWLFDRLPRRALMVASVGLGSLSTMCYAAGQGTIVFLLGRVLWGLAWSGIWVGCNTVVLDLAGETDRGALTGKLNMWFYAGIAFSSLAGGIFTDLFSFRGGLWLSAALSGVGFLIWLLFLPETRRSLEQAAPGLPNRVTENLRKGASWRRALEAAAPYFVQRMVVSGVISATAIVWLAAYFGQGVRLGDLALPLASLSGGFAAMRVLVSLASAPLIGTAADRSRSRWRVLAASLAVGAIGLWAMGLPQVALALLGALLISISAGGVPGLMAALIGDQVHSSRYSRSLGIAFSLGDLGSAVGPSLGLALVGLLGLRETYLICAGLYVLAAIYALLKNRRLFSVLPQ